MNPTLVGMLVALLAMALALWYFFVVKGLDDHGGRAKGAAVTIACVLCPVLAFMLWDQHHAKGRLADTGIVLHPGLGPSMGVATGGWNSPDTWLFEFDGTEAELLDFYRDPVHLGNWNLAEDDGGALLLQARQAQMFVSLGNQKAVFVLSAM